MARYLKSDEEVRNALHQAAEKLRAEDLLPYLKDAEDWEKNHRDEFDDFELIKKSDVNDENKE